MQPVNRISHEFPETKSEPPTPGYLIMDTESVPDGRLLAKVKYPEETIAPEEAIRRAQEEAKEKSPNGSDFLPVTFQYPVAVCMLRVGIEFDLQQITCLDSPKYRPRKIAEQFWLGVEHYKKTTKQRVKIVTFNGRGFDLPLLELAAFRYGFCGRDYFQSSRNRFGGGHIDIMELMTNFNAIRFNGGLNLLSKLLGMPGKMTISGDQVYQMYCEGRLQEINEYCMFDTLDTYFVFLRTRVMLGEMTSEDEQIYRDNAREWLKGQIPAIPALQQYLDNWGEWDPWP